MVIVASGFRYLICGFAMLLHSIRNLRIETRFATTDTDELSETQTEQEEALDLELIRINWRNSS